MPRRERPLDPSDDVVVKFAADLRRLREDAGGPTYRELSTRAGYSAAALSEAAGGRKLPGLALTTAYVTACGGDIPLWEARWRAVAAELAAAEGAEDTEPAETESPYLGLAAFQATDASRFFGREKLLAELTGKVAERRFVGVFGASGSGKSSLLRAGLAATSGERWTMVFTPGAHPLEQCAAGLANSGHILIIDQFEEVFTLCHDDAERNGFINALLELADDGHGSRVVIGVRADFYGHCGRHAGLVDALRDAQVMAGPMTADELRTAIVEPAVRIGCRVEAALVTTLVADAIGQPAVLPLVSHALLETWRRRQGITLTSAAYEAAGGIQNAIAHTAEAGYAALEPDRQAKVRQIFLRLTALGEGTEDTKRRLHRRELDDDAATAEVLERLVDARLLALDRDGVEIAHEALIRSWPRLQDWLAEDREGHRLHRQLAEATDLWESVDRDPGSLYRGTRLALAAEWAARSPDSLTTREQHFLDTGLAAEAVEAAAVRRRTRRLRQLVALLGVLLVLATVATGYAVHATNTATDQRNVALARKVVGDAADLRDPNPALSLQLSLAAYRLAPVQEAKDGLLSALTTPYATRLAFEGGDMGSTDGVSLSGDGKLMAVANAVDIVQLFSLVDPLHPVLLGQLPKELRAHRPVALSSDGRTLAATVDGFAIRLWDVGDPRAPVAHGRITGHTNTLFTLRFTQHDRLLVSGANDHSARLTDITDPDRPQNRAILHPPGDKLYLDAVPSPDGRLLAAASHRVTQLWRIDDPAHPTLLATFDTAQDVSNPSAFSSDGHLLATTGWDENVRLWDLNDVTAPKLLSTMKNTAIVWRASFSRDGRTLVAGTDDQSAWLWDVSNPAAPVRLRQLNGHTNSVFLTEFSPDGHTLVTAGDRTVRLYDYRDLELSARGGVAVAGFTPDGATMVTNSATMAHIWSLAPGRPPSEVAVIDRPPGPSLRFTAATLSQDGSTLGLAMLTDTVSGSLLLRYDIRDPAHPRLLASVATPPTYALAFTPDLHTLAAGYDDGPIQIWDVSDSSKIVPGEKLPMARGTIWSLLYSPNGRFLYSARGAGVDPATTVWDSSDPEKPRQVAELTEGGTTFGMISQTRDGRELLVAGSDGNAYRWDVSDPRAPKPLPPLTGHTDLTTTASITPDGTQAVTAGADHGVKLWDLTGPQPVQATQLLGFTNGATAMFSPDGHTVVAGSVDLRAWETDVDRVAARICALATPKITQAEWDKYLPELPYNPPCP